MTYEKGAELKTKRSNLWQETRKRLGFGRGLGWDHRQESALGRSLDVTGTFNLTQFKFREQTTPVLEVRTMFSDFPL